VILITISALLPLLALSYYANVKSSHALETNASVTMGFEVQSVAKTFRDLIETARSDTLFLAGVPPVQGIIRASENNGYDTRGKSSYQQWVKRLAVIYRIYGTTKPFFALAPFLLIPNPIRLWHGLRMCLIKPSQSHPSFARAATMIFLTIKSFIFNFPAQTPSFVSNSGNVVKVYLEVCNPFKL